VCTDREASGMARGNALDASLDNIRYKEPLRHIDQTRADALYVCLSES
jgi:hypothetical protein